MGKRIVIVDDDKEFLQELEETLRLSDYEVVSVSDSANAVDAVIAAHPDLVMLDLRMPYESGYQVACLLTHFSKLRSIPILAMTAYYDEKLDKMMKAYGIKGCLKKPFDQVEAILKIEELL